MIAARRLHYNFALDRAVELSLDLRKPLLILEALRCNYPWACDRFHRFVLDGMADNAATAARHRVLYYPYLETAAGAGEGLLETLAADACAVVTDDFPGFFFPRMVAAAARKLAVRFEAVDSNGLLPLRAASGAFPTAYAFRRFLQKVLPPHLTDPPCSDPLARSSFLPPPSLAESLCLRWPVVEAKRLRLDPAFLRRLPIDHSVCCVETQGGHSTARVRLLEFFRHKLRHYGEQRNDPGADATSGLSPYLHFGHMSAHEIFAQVVRREKWTPEKLALRATGSREGWWNMSPATEAFLDELITWRELGYNFSAHRTDCDLYESLPDWAQQTLKKHARDERPHLYTSAQFERAQTHDPLWNAAQTQLVREGRIHNYLRMLWGKKILEWSRSPQEAAQLMIHLNNKYALDGRDPNSYSGIFWCFGRYDRPWGPERPVFGTVRYMSSENTARKFSVKRYLQDYGDGPPQSALSF